MSLLKRIGQVIVNASGLITGFGPIFTSATVTTQDDKILANVVDKLDQAFGIITDVEVFKQALSLPGSEAAKAAAPAMFQILLRANIVAGKKCKDPEKAKAAALAMGGNLADFINAFED